MTDIFQKTVEILSKGSNIFITGGGGIGKSYLLNRLKKHYKETLIQKETFITAIAKYFILDRLPEGSLELIEDKYENDNKKELKKLLPSTIDTFYTIYNNCDNKEDLPKKYAEYFNEEVRDFSKEIAENRDDSLSDFAKAIMKVYNNSKSQKQ